MTDLPAPLPFPNPKETLEAFGLRPKRSFGQNFLSDARLVDRIAGLAPRDSFVVEIGAGIGGLTVQLLNRGHHVVAIERDRDLVPVLHSRLAPAVERQQLEICEADAKTLDYPALLGAARQPRVLMGNLPYNLTGPLLQRATECSALFERGVFLVQLEVAERLVAAPSNKTYGGLSVFAQNAFVVRREFIVKRGAFYPQPQVESAVVTFEPRPTPHVPEDTILRGLVSKAFQQRRKTLRNAWSGLFGLTAGELEEVARAAEVGLELRGETLSILDFARMCRSVKNAKPALGKAE